ncbi:MAG: PDZ domain-containing protein, partial [Verrucomicrobiota bacterium]
MKICTGGLSLLCAMTFARAETRTGAYLGVVTAPVDPAVAEHLGLAPGVGLVVEHLDPEGAVKDALKKNDILHKFNDQILISHHQLAVLVRSQKPGDEIKLGIIRKGQSEEVAT